MAAPKRTKDQITKDRAEIARLYLQGWLQQRIADHLGISRDMVTYDLKAIRQAWRNSALVDFNERMGQELAKIDNLEIEYWEAWQRSKEKKETTSTKSIKIGEDFSKDEASLKEEQMLGDPRFLQGIQWCIEKRCKIFGLDAPIKVDWRQMLPADYDAEQVAQQFVDLMLVAANEDSTA